MDTRKKLWEESYSRQENFIFEPKEQVVKFLNRFVRKKVGVDQFIDRMDLSKGAKGLDFGCGIGRQSVLLKQYNIEPYGIDVSELAINKAKELYKSFGFTEDNNFLQREATTLPYTDKFVDVLICDSVLDSMTFELAQKFMKEFDRVLNGFMYVSLIASPPPQRLRKAEEVIVDTKHEFGTIQSYFNQDKINALIKDTNFKITWGSIVDEQHLLSNHIDSRYHLVLKNI